ncbi:hypothetical protein EXS66_00525 [Candidatus Saccharibacteria bacterium]|nr:hypothetical protein [Candidatus Saccharibacteria bacterium]
MNSGLVSHLTKGRLLNSIGTHQKFDRSAYDLLKTRVTKGKFPPRSMVLKFEGSGGPDGLKFKGNYSTDHLWDPVNKIGHLPHWIEVHYKNLVKALRAGDEAKAAFEAGFMAHFLTDSLTPAHHLSHKFILEEYEGKKYRRRWKIYGRKGLLSSHVAFEAGISSAILFTSIKVKFDNNLLLAIKKDGIREVVLSESLAISKHQMYEKFLDRGWSTKLAKTIKATTVKRIPQLIAAAWFSAYEEAYQPAKK